MYTLSSMFGDDYPPLQYTVFVLISAHAPIRAHLGRFRKACALAHTAQLIFWYFTQIVHNNTTKQCILTSTQMIIHYFVTTGLLKWYF